MMAIEWTIPSEEKTAYDWLFIAQQAENAGILSDPQFIKDQYFELAKHYRKIAASLARNGQEE